MAQGAQHLGDPQRQTVTEPATGEHRTFHEVDGMPQQGELAGGGRARGPAADHTDVRPVGHRHRPGPIRSR
ncbi:hypothetical protein ACVWXU_003107 [Streptomyces sp. TE33382]